MAGAGVVPYWQNTNAVQGQGFQFICAKYGASGGMTRVTSTLSKQWSSPQRNPVDHFRAAISAGTCEQWGAANLHAGVAVVQLLYADHQPGT
jgi:hypothetical protein